MLYRLLDGTFCRQGRQVRLTLALPLLALLLLGTPSARALSTADAFEAAVTAARDQALRQGAAAAADSERVKTAATQRVAALEHAVTADREELAGLQKQLLAMMSRDDPAAIRAVRARLAAGQAALDADDGEKSLVQKDADEAERNRDVLKRRADTLGLALRLDLRVMLAMPVEIEDREKRVEAARKEIDAQAGQIQKYLTRRAAAAVALENVRHRLKILTRAVDAALPPEVAAARAAEAGQVRRLVGQQVAWFRLNGQLEERAWRNLAFAQSEYLVSRRLADGLARKGDLRRAGDFEAQAERSEAQLATVRAALAPEQQKLTASLAEAVGQADVALKALGEARQAQEETAAHKAYALAQFRRQHIEAESDCWKEFASLQKSGTSFARERADRAREVAEDHGPGELMQEELQLRGSLGTSEQYVKSFELLMATCDTAIDTARRELGLEAERVTEISGSLAELFGSFDATQPPTPALVADLLLSLTQRLEESVADSVRHSAEARRDLAATLVARVAQREMLRARKVISVAWLEHSREVIRVLAQLEGRTLWQQHDLRLNASTVGEACGVAGLVVGSAWLNVESWVHRIDGIPGVPPCGQIWLGLALTLLAGLCGWLAARRIPARHNGWCWLAARLLVMLPSLLCGGWWVLQLGAGGNRSLLWLGLTLLALAGWLGARSVLRSVCPGQEPPPGEMLAGGLFTAFDTLALWAVILFPLYRLADGVENNWDVRAVVGRLWLFGMCVAAFHLALHPTLGGRFLSRRSKNRSLRWFGTLAAVICTVAAALATLTYLAGLDNLGRTVLHTTEATFAALLVAMAVLALLNWVQRRHLGWSDGRVALIRAMQTIALCLAGVGVAWSWWRLLNRVVLAPNAPQPIPEMVQAVSQTLKTLLRIWRHPLNDEMTVRSLAFGLLVVAVSFWVSREIKRQFMRSVLTRTPMDEGTRQTFTTILGYGVVLLGFLLGLNVAGASLKNLTLLVGAITVGLGFGLQNVINNFVSSLLIHFGRSIRVGDYIDVGGTRGCVREIGLRNTMLVTDDEITVLVPNGSFISSNIINWTNPSRRTRLHVPVVVTRQADLTAVTELAVAIGAQHALVMKAPAPTVEVRSVTATQVTLDLLVWSEKPERLTAITGELSLALDRALRERGWAI